MRLLAIGCACAALAGCLPTEERPSITVVGTATYEVEPDVFIVGGTAEARAKSKADAVAALAEQLDSLRTTLPRLEGLTHFELETDAFGVQAFASRECEEVYDYSADEACEPSLWYASIPFEARGKPVSRAGDAVSLASELVSGPVRLRRYTVSQPDAAQGEAVAMAVAAGRVRAERIARASGTSLGTLVAATPQSDEQYYDLAASRRTDEIVVADDETVTPTVAIDLDPAPRAFDASIVLTFRLNEGG